MNAAAQHAPRAVPPHPPTIADVARLAGVAKTTVSYTLNDSGFVSAERRARILAAIEELGYRPNTNARALRLQTTTRIGIVCADLTEGPAARIVNGIRAAARSHRLTVVLLEEDPAREAIGASGAGSEVDGVIVYMRDHIHAGTGGKSTALPVVDVSDYDEDEIATPESVGSAAVDQLLETLASTTSRARSTAPERRRHNRSTTKRAEG